MGKKKNQTSAPTAVFCCLGSDCCKHGGDEVYEAFRAELRASGTKHEVALLELACTGLCKHGPITIVCNSDGVRWYRKMKPKDAKLMVQNHFVDDGILQEKRFSE